MHYANTNFESVSEFDWRVGFYLGGLTEYKFSNDWFALQAELLYSNQGAKRKLDLTLLGEFTSSDPVFFEKLDINYTFSYLTLPILAKFYVTKGLNLFAGPQIKFLLSASANDQTITKGYDTVSLSSVGGIGYQLENGFFAEARYIYGLTNIDKDFAGSFTRETYKNRVVQLGLGYKF